MLWSYYYFEVTSPHRVRSSVIQYASRSWFVLRRFNTPDAHRMLSSLYRKFKTFRSDLLTYSCGQICQADWFGVFVCRLDRGKRSYYGCASTTWFMLIPMIRRTVKVVTAGQIVFRFRFYFGLVVMLLADVDRGKGRVSCSPWRAFLAFSISCFWRNIRDQLQIGLHLVRFQRSTRDPFCILSCLIAL
jgi:hypothetical protein